MRTDTKPSTTKMNVWVLSDGSPGHYNQSRGVVDALGYIASVDVEWLDVRLRIGFLRQLLKFFLNHSSFGLPEWLLRTCYRYPVLPEKSPDVIVSAGGKTSFLNALLARKFNCKNIFTGSLRGLSDTHFSAVLTIHPIPGAVRNIVLDIAPTVITPEVANTAGREFCQKHKLENDRLWAMVIGGDGAGYHYDDSDWENLAGAMTVLADKYRIKWLLTTSRRTGDIAEKKLKDMIPDKIVASCVWYATNPQHVMLAYLGASELVFCTEDSMSMIAESIASGRAVVALSPRKSDPEARYVDSLQNYVDKSLICRFQIESVGCLSSADFNALKPLQTSNSLLLAEKLRFILCSPAGEDAS